MVHIVSSHFQANENGYLLLKTSTQKLETPNSYSHVSYRMTQDSLNKKASHKTPYDSMTLPR